jgi:hypothetical protein
MSAAAAAYQARPRRRWIWVVVALVTAVALVVPVAFRIALKGDIRHQIVPLTLIQQPISGIQVDAPGQSVTVLRGRPGQVSVLSDVSWLLGRPAIRHAWHGRILRLSASCPAFNVFGDCQVGLVIRVPAGVQVQVAVGSGSAALAGLTGPVHVTASSGSISLTDISGPLWAAATSGTVIATSGLTSARVVAAVSSGRLALGFAQPPEALALKVGSGSAAVTVPPGGRYRISGERGSGTLQVGPGLGDSGAARFITAVLGSGHVAIGYLQLAPSAPLAS